ncbi:TIR domain-containing protein [Sphingomicrobium marinum]|uniref:TIR domain-containing protein n=1 Tax=Sphingomicrobium marinum TaxID=1227950 RepID=UPI00223F59C5|nr:TIR domain-containing protein [Sphingomicrobium marinum]
MADIFLSYARADQPRVEKLAAALEEAGYSLWWDKHLRSGHQFSDDIEAALAKAKAVLVIWSADAVKSEWVRDEAAIGRDGNKLVAARIDDTLPPIGFRQRHAIDLDDADAMASLTQAFDALIGGTHEVATPALTKKRTPNAALLALPLLAAIGGLGYWAWDGGLDGTADEVAASTSLAVIPLSTLGNDDIAFLGEGISGSITNDLARLEGLQLTANASVNAVAGQGLSAAQIGEQLGVSHFVEGQLQQVGDEMRADISLIDTSNGAQIWNKSYRRSKNALQSMQADMASDLAAALQSRLGVGAGRVAAAANVDPRAYEAYLRGREAQTRRNDITKRRQAYAEYRRAVSIAPDFADAHAGLAYILVVSGGSGDLFMSQEELKGQYVEALEAVERLDPDNLLGRAAKSVGQLRFEADLEGSIRTAQSILDEAPDHAPALYSLGFIHLRMGNHLEARTVLNAALNRDPSMKTSRARISLASRRWVIIRACRNMSVSAKAATI